MALMVAMMANKPCGRLYADDRDADVYPIHDNSDGRNDGNTDVSDDKLMEITAI